MRIIHRKHYRHHCDQLFYASKILKVDQLYELKLYKLYCNCINLDIPEYFKTWSFETNFDISGINTRHGTRTYYAPLNQNRVYFEIINSLNINKYDLSTALLSSTQKLVRYMKPIMFVEYDTTCISRNCYPCSLCLVSGCCGDRLH